MVSERTIVGIDVSRDWLDGYCLTNGWRIRLPNTAAGHDEVIAQLDALPAAGLVVGFEATGGQEWALWAALEAAGLDARQLPPAQIKAFAASRGTRAKTDRIDAELIARFMAFRPEAGRRMPSKTSRILNALTSKRAQIVEMRKRLLAQAKARAKQAVPAGLEEMDDELRTLFSAQIQTLERRIAEVIAGDVAAARKAALLRSIPGIGPVTAALLIGDMPELGRMTSAQAAAMTGLAPIPHDSGALRGKRAIAGGRRHLRHVLFQAALVAAHHNPSLKTVAGRLQSHGKPHKAIIIAVARHLITTANAILKAGSPWKPQRSV